MGITNYSTLTIEYAEQRENRERFIKFDASDDESLIPSEPDITILNRTKIKKNMEGCVNTLSLECMHFFAVYGKDGANCDKAAAWSARREGVRRPSLNPRARGLLGQWG